MKAFLNNYRQSPRKVRLVASLIRGKNAELALVELNFLPKRAALPIQKLLLSAISNAVAMGIPKENLFVKEVRVDKGVTMRRMMPAAMGTGHRINKRTSHVALFLGEKITEQKGDKKRSKQATRKEAVKEVKKAKDKSVIFCPKPSKSPLHATQKPLSLMRRLILNSTSIGDVVYEPCAGSGTTGIACEQTKRKCIMIELDAEYCQTIIARFSKLEIEAKKITNVKQDEQE